MPTSVRGGLIDTLFLITARAGSKGVPGKNLKQIGGLSLIGWKVRAARAAGAERIVISTDSEEIAAEARRHGVEVPFMRPAELATDTASSGAVIAHALESLGQYYGQVMLLEPSAPFATGHHMRKALLMMEALDADLVVGMKTTEPNTAFIGEHRAGDSVTPIIVNMKRHGRHLRRQDLPNEWTMAGNLYLFKTSMFRSTNDIYGGVLNYGLLTDKYHAIEIDSPEDLELAEFAFERGYVRLEDA